MYQEPLEFLRLTRNGTLALVSGLTQAQADYDPGAGGWTVGQVLDHLLLAEKLYRDLISRLIDLEKSGRRPVIREGFREVNTSIAYIPKSVLPFLEVPLTVFNLFVPPFVREIMTEFRVLPAQNPDVAVPAKGRPIDQLRQALKQSCADTAALLGANPAVNYRRLRYSHPLMGDNHVLNILRIVSFHERRHQSQIRDVLALRDFPKAA